VTKEGIVYQKVLMRKEPEACYKRRGNRKKRRREQDSNCQQIGGVHMGRGERGGRGGRRGQSGGRRRTCTIEGAGGEEEAGGFRGQVSLGVGSTRESCTGLEGGCERIGASHRKIWEGRGRGSQ